MTNILNDAGLLREYVSEHYGSLFTYGGCSSMAWSNAGKDVARLAKMTGLTREEIISDIKKDHEMLENN